MIFLFRLFIATTVAVHVAGSRLEATEGQNVSMLFKTGLERVKEGSIIFEGENKGEFLRARYCSPDAGPICEPIYDQLLHVEKGNVSFILGNVTSSQSGLYTAEVITADNHVLKVTLTLVVNQAPASSSPAHPHSSSSPNLPSSSTSPNPPSFSHSYNLHWIVIAIISLVIIVSGGVCFWIHRKKCKSAADEEEATEAPAVSRSSGCVAMNGCGGNAEALLPSKTL